MTILKRSFAAVVSPFLLSLLATNVNAQKIDTIGTYSISAYVDGYYAYYTDSLGPGDFQKWPNTSPRSNAPSINIAQLSFLYNGEKIRAAAVLGFGDFNTCTWAPAPYNNVMEAHVGFKLNSKFWIDAGFFRTHFGTEYLLPVENITSSIAVGTYYEPPFEGGIRLNFDPTKKLEINLFLLNGYGMFVDNNNKKSFGAGVTYSLGENSGIGYTNYIGDDTPPAIPETHLRIHQNIFYNKQVKKVKIQLGADYCLQEKSDLATARKMASMYSALATVRYQLTKRAAVYARGEVFSDPDALMAPFIIDARGHRTGYKLWGATAGFEYKPTEESYVRLENRLLQMDNDQQIFQYQGAVQNMRYEIMVHAGVSFDLLRNVLTKSSN